MIRVGQGIDVHPFDEARPLILGGVRISDRGGLAGHSDADAVLHALTDALLGATGSGDIGHYFPSDDPQWKNAERRMAEGIPVGPRLLNQVRQIAQASAAPWLLD